MKELIAKYPICFRSVWMSWNTPLVCLFFIAPIWLGGGIVQIKYKILVNLGMLVFLPIISYMVHKAHYRH